MWRVATLLCNTQHLLELAKSLEWSLGSQICIWSTIFKNNLYHRDFGHRDNQLNIRKKQRPWLLIYSNIQRNIITYTNFDFAIWIVDWVHEAPSSKVYWLQPLVMASKMVSVGTLSSHKFTKAYRCLRAYPNCWNKKMNNHFFPTKLLDLNSKCTGTKKYTY